MALIPAFGAIYSLLGPGSFYDANIQREPSLMSDAQHLSTDITDDLSVPRRAPVWRTKSGLLQLEPTSLKARSIRHTADGRLLIDVTGYYRQPQGSAATRRGFEEWLRVFTFGGGTRIDPRAGGPALGGYDVELSDVDGGLSQPLGIDPPPSLIVPPIPKGAVSSSSPPATTMWLPLPTFARLTRFYRAAEGDPWYASDRWWRMTYLSEVTVTTLGFGDITPVTGAARAAVAFEAMLGIVVIGLFVNSVARRSLRRRDDDD